MDYAISALHVVEHGRKAWGHPAVLANAGIWSCSIAAAWSDHDIALLRLGQKLAERIQGRSLPSRYPGVGGSRYSFGLSVGYFGGLHRENRSGKQDRYTYFASASLSFFTRDVHRWALSAGFAEEGFSGSPVFTSNGSLVGVLTEIMQLAQPTPSRMPQLVTVPLMSPIDASVVREIARISGATLSGE